MGWLYKATRNLSITKEEGEIKLIRTYRNGWHYPDYFFVNSQGKRSYLSTYDEPQDGFMVNRAVYLVNEDDERAKDFLIKDYEKTIKQLEKRITNCRNAIRNLMSLEVDRTC